LKGRGKGGKKEGKKSVFKGQKARLSKEKGRGSKWPKKKVPVEFSFSL